MTKSGSICTQSLGAASNALVCLGSQVHDTRSLYDGAVALTDIAVSIEPTSSARVPGLDSTKHFTETQKVDCSQLVGD